MSSWTYLCYNRTSTHGAALADSASRQDNGTSADPAILLNRDRSSQLRTLPALSLLRIDRERAGKNADVRSNHTVVPDLNLACVVDGTVSADYDLIANRDVISVIAGEGSLDSNVPTNPSNIGDR